MQLVGQLLMQFNTLAMTTLNLPILYSYRRCPYAMRARIALHLSNIAVEMFDISMHDKPAYMLQVSPKGTVPLLVLPSGVVLDESLVIMIWAFSQPIKQSNEDNQNTLSRLSAATKNIAQLALIETNDTTFKKHLDGYKYPERYPQHSQLAHRQMGEVFLAQLEDLLLQNMYLIGTNPSFADYAIFPFVRQFAAVDSDWFNGDANCIVPYPQIQQWLNRLVTSDAFTTIMQKLPLK